MGDMADRAMEEEWLDGMFEPGDERIVFASPGSALRAASKSNPRNLPCPTCGVSDRLTPKDVALHYQCDVCADRAEGGW